MYIDMLRICAYEHLTRHLNASELLRACKPEHKCVHVCVCMYVYRVATVSSIDKIIGLFCKRAL